MGSSSNDFIAAAEKWSEFTVSQLNYWGVKYHKLFFGNKSSPFLLTHALSMLLVTVKYYIK
jgi:hypothetical protein